MPLRMCVACRQARCKAELLRVVKCENGVVIDKTGKMNGRGAYVCAAPACIEKAFQKKMLARALKASLPEELQQQLLEEAKADGS